MPSTREDLRVGRPARHGGKNTTVKNCLPVTRMFGWRCSAGTEKLVVTSVNTNQIQFIVNEVSQWQRLSDENSGAT